MIFQCLEECDRIRRKEANAASTTEAQGWAALLMGFGGENAPKLDPRNLMPYPEDAISDSDRRLSRKTASMMLQLEREGKFPSRFLAEAAQFLDEAKKRVK